MELKKIIKNLNKTSPLSTISGTKASDETPRDRFIKKEKELKLKFFIILFLSHLLWPIALMPNEQTKQVASKTNTLFIQIPVHNYVYLPPEQTRVPVTIRRKKDHIYQKAFLHRIVHSDRSPSGKEAILEITKQSAHIIKRNPHLIYDLLPYSKNQYKIRHKSSDGPKEINI